MTTRSIRSRRRDQVGDRSQPKPIRLGFDARLAGPAHAGIGRYSEELLRELLRLSSAESQYEWVVFVAQPNQLPWLKRYSHVQVRLLPVRHYTLREQLIGWWILRAAQLDVLHVPHFNVPLFYRRPFVVTIHDLLWHTQRDARATTLSPWQHRLKYWAYRWVSQSAMRRAKAILVPTEWVKQQVVTYAHNDTKIWVTSEGMSDVFQQAPEVGKEKRGSKTKERAPYVVYTGSLYPHKNVEVILEALAHLPTLHLKVITARSAFISALQKSISRLGLQERVTVQSGLPDEAVLTAYQSAVALIQPSLSEGFGLTGIEALAAGVPLVASDIPVFREVYQAHAHYFDPHDAQSLQAVLQKLLTSAPSLKDRQAGQAFVQRYRWDVAAQRTWKAYQSALAQV